MIFVASRSEDTQNLQLVLLRVNNIIFFHEGFKYDMFMKMLWLLGLHSTPLNQVGEVLNNLPCFQVGMNMGL